MSVNAAATIFWRLVVASSSGSKGNARSCGASMAGSMRHFGMRRGKSPLKRMLLPVKSTKAFVGALTVLDLPRMRSLYTLDVSKAARAGESTSPTTLSMTMDGLPSTNDANRRLRVSSKSCECGETAGWLPPMAATTLASKVLPLP